MRKDLVTFGKYKDRYWEDVVLSDINYVKWVLENHEKSEIRDIAQYWLNGISQNTEESINFRNKHKFQVITKDSEEYIVDLLGKDDARQLALNIFALTE